MAPEIEQLYMFDTTVFWLPDQGQDSQVSDPNHPFLPNGLQFPTPFHNIFILEMRGRFDPETVSDPIATFNLSHSTFKFFPITKLLDASHYEKLLTGLSFVFYFEFYLIYPRFKSFSFGLPGSNPFERLIYFPYILWRLNVSWLALGLNLRIFSFIL